MREVIGPHQPAPVHLVGRAKGHPVVLKGREDVLGEVFAGQLLELDAGGQPVAMAGVGVIHSVQIMRHPAGISLDADDFQSRVALEDSAEDQRADYVLIAANDRQKGVDARPAHFGAVLARQDMKRQRQIELDGRFPNRVIDR